MMNGLISRPSYKPENILEAKVSLIMNKITSEKDFQTKCSTYLYKTHWLLRYLRSDKYEIPSNFQQSTKQQNKIPLRICQNLRRTKVKYNYGFLKVSLWSLSNNFTIMIISWVMIRISFIVRNDTKVKKI